MIRPLEKETIRKISSGQVIVHIDNVVKELCENALDAEANSITIRLVDGGLTSISVKDNGTGIAISDRPNMTKRYHTSKITSLKDLSSVSSYGFRGLLSIRYITYRNWY
ncbi:ATPase domain of HSP90 chaperone/DNA topoisomerase II/histidine kinase [Basidiobolus meristosporus CBS 931.73]|uniref:ATPase domain of HSP90 chaperone/DNA topoisomerase II/histidine kinase n=1 Tax=Basidiobolus meristosporus CBS 931.73 TaxID=1314790 RepID=A0A1Y1YGU4_9FUNG|nr:ATPase domain of HSP90 chaperone/DNA topoisomerase II/histidine kinase [Basidiobolus meristosporus CBS 931.73]|eukprot:ORX97083.1 ATPase domain of HSP90 chaperone/DNA topoisomerase II/histidine kinase [Basidiobolus meristosporus CBS 931.73]